MRDLAVSFGGGVRAVRGVSLDIAPGEIVGLVGESGSGKSVLGLSLLGLLPSDPAPELQGSATVAGTDMVAAAEARRRDVRRDHLGAVFQDPMSSLNPTMRIGRQLVEASGPSRDPRDLLELVGLTRIADRLNAYPHELSGGQRQRV